MMKVLSWISGGDEGRAVEPVHVPIERVEEFTRYFPIGTRLRYTPEFQVSTKIETIILGYRINGHLIFETHNLAFGFNQGFLTFSMRTDRGVQPVSSVNDFCFVLPHQFRSEVDFGGGFGDVDRAKEKKVNDFRRGAVIQLMNKGTDGRVPTVQTQVAQTLAIADGVYANLRVVLLTPEPDSFALMDQRAFHRVYTQIPGTATVDVNGPRYKCMVQDFSERYLRFDLSESPEFAATLREGAKLFVVIEGEGAVQTILVGGQVYRRRETMCILALTHMLKDKRLQRIDPIDELELKTKLLHHPKTMEFTVEE